MASPLLSLQGVSKSFGGVQALSDVSLRVYDSGVLGIIGPNGAGKSTLAGIIVGALKPDRGKVFFRGREITNLTVRERAALGVAHTHQIPRVFQSLTVYENLELAASRRVSRRDLDGIIREAAEKLGLNGLLELGASQLSSGQLRLLEIGMALLSQPLLLVMDEPTQGLAGLEVNYLSNILRSLSERLAIILIDHRVDFVASLSNRVAVMSRGRVVGLGRIGDVEVVEKIEAVYMRGA
ncbi:MAG: ATP-binding cassette domain-containing protein [Nitrososphaerota archaeon]